MRTVKYKEWQVQCYNDEPVTVDNFYKYDIIIKKTDGKFVTRINKEELCLSQVEQLLSGDDTLAQQALNSIISDKEIELYYLKEFNSNKLTFKRW